MRILSVLALVSGLCVIALSQGDADPNYDSPSPILLTDANSTRALTQLPAKQVRVSRAKGADLRSSDQKTVEQAFQLDSKITLYVSDLQLMKGEGANAFRLYAEDGRGHLYRFPVLDIQQSAELKNMWAVTVLLTDEVGYYEPPAADGDVLIYLTWRGMASNKVRLGLGKTGGDIKESRDARPTPIGTTALNTTNIVNATQRANDHARFLEQATFGPVRNFDDQFVGLKLTRWINNQFNLTYPSATNPYPDDNTNYPLRPSTAPTNCDGDQTVVPDVPVTCFRDTYTMYPIQTWNSKEMLYGDAQLRHRVSWALSQIWVTSGVDIQQSRHMVEYHKILSNNAFGNYRNLMQQMTLSPTMGDYLSMSQSTKTNPNENYAREIMQLFTVGLFMLNQDGTVICVEHNPCQTGDTPVPTYDQNNVNNLTKVFTGWTFCNNGTLPQCSHAPGGGIVNYIDPMIMTTTGNHDTTAKTLLSYSGSTTTNVAACANCTGGSTAQNLANTQTYAANTMNQALDNLFYHPNLGPYVCKILIQQMVTSNPTPAYVSRVAAVFNSNNVGVRGDMKSVISAILLDPEARGSVKTDPNYGKLREPVQYAANILRSLNVRDISGSGQSDGVLTGTGSYTGMSQVPFRSPTVFNYYPPSFIIPGTGLLGPEFALMTTGTAIQRANFVNQVAFGTPGLTFGNTVVPVSANSNSGGAPSGTSTDLSDLQALVVADPTGGTMVDELNRRMLHGTMSSTMRQSIVTSVGTLTGTDTMGKVRQALYLVATSSQYQVQR